MQSTAILRCVLSFVDLHENFLGSAADAVKDVAVGAGEIVGELMKF